MKKIAKKLSMYSIATVSILNSHSLAGQETITKGPYEIEINSSGEFGLADYKYSFKISKDNEILLEKTSESSIQGYELNKGLLHYVNSKLWVFYQEVIDGMDPRSVFLVQFSNSGFEQAQASYEPLNPAESLKILSIPENWNKSQTLGLIKEALGIKEVASNKINQTPKQESKKESKKEENEPEESNAQHSMEW